MLRRHGIHSAEDFVSYAKGEPYRYAESGLPNIILLGIEVLKCPECGSIVARIPDVSGLHRAIASYVTKLDRRLVPAEMTFLDKFVRYNATDQTLLRLHEEMGEWPRSTPDARKRVELYLRLITLLTLDDESLRKLKDDSIYALAQTAGADETEPQIEQPPEQRFQRSKNNWEPRALLAG